jgi:hypothetical protein
MPRQLAGNIGAPTNDCPRYYSSFYSARARAIQKWQNYRNTFSGRSLIVNVRTVKYDYDFEVTTLLKTVLRGY